MKSVIVLGGVVLCLLLVVAMEMLGGWAVHAVTGVEFVAATQFMLGATVTCLLAVNVAAILSTQAFASAADDEDDESEWDDDERVESTVKRVIEDMFDRMEKNGALVGVSRMRKRTK